MTSRFFFSEPTDPVEVQFFNKEGKKIYLGYFDGWKGYRRPSIRETVFDCIKFYHTFWEQHGEPTTVTIECGPNKYTAQITDCKKLSRANFEIWDYKKQKYEAA